MIVAGEASSALYARRLLEHWRDSGVRVKAFGVGSRDMEALGFDIIGRSEDMAVVGIVEVLKHYKEIKNVFEGLVAAVKERRPQVLLLLDYPDFNLRLAKRLKPLGIPIVYYISPQVWAWRKSRIHEIKKCVSKMLVVLPFEKEFYARHGVDVEFVGHPLLDELSSELFDPALRAQFRSRYGVQNDEIWVGIMPGSRKSELRHHLKTQISVCESLYERHPQLKFALLVAPTFSKEEVRAQLPDLSLPLTLLSGEPLSMVRLMDVILCASGTATLVVGLLKKPMVIMYKMNALTAWIARWIVKGTAHFGLINLILGKRVVPELFQSEATVDRLSQEVLKFVEDKNYRQSVVDELTKTSKLLGERGATSRVANILTPMLRRT